MLFSHAKSLRCHGISTLAAQRTGLRCLQFIGGRKPPFESNSAREKEIDQKKVGKFVITVTVFAIILITLPLERFSLDCRKTKTKVNTLANQRA